MTFLDEIPCLVIHREQDKEREPVIQRLEGALSRRLQRFEGIDGVSLIATGFPTKHPREHEPTTAGNIGCTASHVEILDACSRSSYAGCAIFEDDAELSCDPVLLRHFLEEEKGDWDLCFLGVNELVETTPFREGLVHVKRFWGTHAVIVKQKAMLAILEMYRQSLMDGYALPADWLYSYAIQRSGLIAVAPMVPLVRQRPGLVSLISGKVRG
jgi:GR25 family glycosyltransferase involved in LPS biosynthesis